MAITELQAESADSKPRTINDALWDLDVARSNVEALSAAIEQVEPLDDECGYLISYNDMIMREMKRMEEISSEIAAIHRAGGPCHA